MIAKIYCLLSLTLICLDGAGAGEAERGEEGMSCNFQIKPLLANHCFRCHGPDEKSRKAKLRLDMADDAYAKKAWVPGKVLESEAVKRMLSTDPDEQMPPPEANLDLTDAEKEMLQEWVEKGATYEAHWAFTPPVAPPVPEFQAAPEKPSKQGKGGKDNKTAAKKRAGRPEAIPRGKYAAPDHFKVRNPIDAFVLDGLRAEGLVPSKQATEEQILRRMTLDLTGLPPTLGEIDDCLKDESKERWKKVVDRLLDSPAFGERMATEWLDAARYADSYGRHEDADSPVWPYRDWVVRAFNQNLPYDQFLTWQTAGDLLPNPTQDQLIATAFNRLANQSNEAGSNEEEFRQDIIADRVKTNGTAIMGLTLECARCHDHKYDPISTKDYYSFGAFLNNINELGLYSESTAGVPAPTMYLFNDAEQAQHNELARGIRQAELRLDEVTKAAAPQWTAWKAAHGNPGAATPTDYFNFEVVEKKGEKSAKRMVPNIARPMDTVNVCKAVPERIQGVKGQALVLDSVNALLVEGRGQFHRSDPFSFSLWLNPTVDQERAVILHRSVAGLEAASRGYEIILDHMYVDFALSHVAPGNSIRIRTNTKLPLNKWTHLVATYDGSSRVEGLKLYLDGQLAEVQIISNHLYKDITYREEWGDFDPSKVQNNVHTTVELTLGTRYNDMGAKGLGVDELKVFPLTLTAAEAEELHTGKLPNEEASAFQRYLRDSDQEYQKALEVLHAARKAEDDFVSKAHELMVMSEMETPRETFVLNRGQFDQRGQKVSPATPASLWEMPEDFPKNRLGLAKWYTDPRNPLVARVAVNRIWQMFFGKGLVSTPEDFGIQGQLPSHPGLLDWLACDFRDHGWDVKRLCRNIVFSSTYRQNSLPANPKALELDPDNRLLSRGPRHRLSAEMLRDLALHAAKMITEEGGGEPVHSYLPENLYPDSGIQEFYKQDHGAGLWKRSLYLYRKRTLPLPFLTTFDASTREYCRVRREITATPLQALVLLNAPDFLEPCRVLAEKSLASDKSQINLIIRRAFRSFTGRLPSAVEQKVLETLHAEQLAFYEKHPEEAALLVSKSGETPPNPALPAPAVAALTMVNRLILSDDDTVMKK